jgi:hypothetical protein
MSRNSGDKIDINIPATKFITGPVLTSEQQSSFKSPTSLAESMNSEVLCAIMHVGPRILW